MRQPALIFFYLTRASMVVFWLLILAAFLYTPYLSYFFPNQNSLNIYTWADIFDIKQVREFEKQTGTKINLIYYDNGEELVSKLEITQGWGYDLMVLGDSYIPGLVQKNLLAKIDKNKLNFWVDLKPELLNQDYDLGNLYSLPYSWDIYGIGVDLDRFDHKLPISSWELVFNSKLSGKNIGMVEEGLRAFCIAMQYLYGNIETVNLDQMQQIKKLLINQKEIVEVYTELLGEYLLYSKSVPVVASQAAYIGRIMKNNPQIKFLVPQEGGFISTENFAILKSSNKNKLIYSFINFMYQKKVVDKFVKKTGFLPSRQDVLFEMDLSHLGGYETINANLFDRVGYFKYVAPREEVSRLWIEVKAS